MELGHHRHRDHPTDRSNGLYGIVNKRGRARGDYDSDRDGAMLSRHQLRMLARVYPSAGPHTLTSARNSSGLGYLTGWAMVMDYILNR